MLVAAAAAREERYTPHLLSPTHSPQVGVPGVVVAAEEEAAAAIEGGGDVADALGLDADPAVGRPGGADDVKGREGDAAADEVGADVEDGAADAVERDELVGRGAVTQHVDEEPGLLEGAHRGVLVGAGYGVEDGGGLGRRGRRDGTPGRGGGGGRGRGHVPVNGPGVLVVVGHVVVVAGGGDEADVVAGVRVGDHGLDDVFGELDDVGVDPDDMLLVAQGAQHQVIPQGGDGAAALALYRRVVALLVGEGGAGLVGWVVVDAGAGEGEGGGGLPDLEVLLGGRSHQSQRHGSQIETGRDQQVEEIVDGAVGGSVITAPGLLILIQDEHENLGIGAVVKGRTGAGDGARTAGAEFADEIARPIAQHGLILPDGGLDG